jgi:glycosyltransferase involved in cell wall biosynthesis
MKITLLMSTYERPEALAAVLRSVERQTRRPDEVVIGDDGSGPETAGVIREAEKRGLNIRHCWEEHQGFRAGRMRNLSLAASTGDYVIIIDDDILLHPEFVADHEATAAPGFFVQGSRALLGEKASAEAMRADAYWPSFFRPGIGNRKNLVRCRLLSRLFGRPHGSMRGIRTCNFALWRGDFIRVNGFNEDFVGWGREDSEFAARLYQAGLRRRNIRFQALVCHLHHPPRSRESLEHNDTLLAETLRRGAARCERGLNLHLGNMEKAAAGRE